MSAISIVYQNYVKVRFSTPSEMEIAALERKIGIKLPPEYRQFLLEYNGGRFRDNDLVLWDGKLPRDTLACLYGIHADDESAELCKRSDLLLFEDNLPPQIIVIGRTVIGCLILLSVHPEDAGDIIYKTPEGAFVLTKSLETFFGMIVDPLPLED